MSLARRFWVWTTQRRPDWKQNRKEAAIAFGVFGVTGSASVGVVRPALKSAGLEGSMMEGPNTYRVASILIVSPIYACTLVAVGTLVGRHRFFGSMSSRLLGRFNPFGGKILCPPARAAMRTA
jgi:hypothetical protein